MTAEMEASVEMVKLAGSMVRALVSDPDFVQVTAVQMDQSVTLQVIVRPADLGKVIGKQGRTARSLRTIVGGASRRLGMLFELNIVQPGEGRQQGKVENA